MDTDPSIAPNPYVRIASTNAAGVAVGSPIGEFGSKAIVVTNGMTKRLVDPWLPSVPMLTLGDAREVNDAGQIAADGRLDTPFDPDGFPFDFVTLILRPLPPSVADLDGSCSVDATHLAILLCNWGGEGEIGDANADGSVDAEDLSLLLGEWVSSSPFVSAVRSAKFPPSWPGATGGHFQSRAAATES